MILKLTSAVIESYEFKKVAPLAFEYQWKAVVFAEVEAEKPNLVLKDNFYFVVVSDNYRDKRDGLHIDMRRERLDIVEVLKCIEARLSRIKSFNDDNFHDHIKELFIEDE